VAAGKIFVLFLLVLFFGGFAAMELRSRWQKNAPNNSDVPPSVSEKPTRNDVRRQQKGRLEEDR
jgi:hypothetical protein